MVTLLLTLLLSFASADSADESAMENDDFKPAASDRCGADLITDLDTEMLTMLCQSSGDTRCLKGLAIKSKMLADTINSGLTTYNTHQATVLGYSTKAREYAAQSAPYYNRVSRYVKESRRLGRDSRFAKGLQRLRSGLMERLARKNINGSMVVVARDRLARGGQRILSAATKSIGVLLFVADMLNFFSAEAAPANPENCRHFSNNKIPTLFINETQTCVPLYDGSQKPVLNFFEANQEVRLETLKNKYTCHYYNKLLQTFKVQNIAAAEEVLEDFKLHGAPTCDSANKKVKFKVLVANRHIMALDFQETESLTQFDISTSGSGHQAFRVKIPTRPNEVAAPEAVESINKMALRGHPTTETVMGTTRYDQWISSTILLDSFSQKALHSLPIVTSRMSACCETDNPAACFTEKVELAYTAPNDN